MIANGYAVEYFGKTKKAFPEPSSVKEVEMTVNLEEDPALGVYPDYFII